MNLNPDIPGAPVETVLFAAFALTAIFGAVRVVTARDPFVSALSLLFNFVSLGALYLLLDQDFVAISQILVYAGAVIVLFLFVIAYLGDRRELEASDDTERLHRLRPLGLATVLALGGLIVGVVVKADFHSPAKLTETTAGHAFGSAQAIGEIFMTRYVLAFEVTSLVLLVAAIGGIVLGLTGRGRHDRLRKLMQTRSADQQRRIHEAQERTVRAGRQEETS